MWQTLSFTAANRDLDTYVAIDTGPGDATQQDGSAQGIRVFAQLDNSTNASTLEFCLVRGNQVYAAVDATLTPTSRRTVAANTSGLYVCAVAFPDTTDKLDLLGDWYESRQKDRGVGGRLAGAVWMVGLKTLGGSTTDVQVQIAPSSVA